MTNTSTHITVPLWQLAHGRTGDKGNRSNISVIAWEPALYPVLLDQVTPACVAQRFVHRQPTHIQRYELPHLHALNFVMDDALDGGVNDSLNLDSHGKALSFWLMDLPIAVPAAVQALLKRPIP